MTVLSTDPEAAATAQAPPSVSIATTETLPPNVSKVQGKADTFNIEWAEVGPDYILTHSKRNELTHRERRIGLSYLWAKHGLKCFGCGGPLPLNENGIPAFTKGLPRANIHHTILDSWKMRDLRLTHAECNQAAGRPPKGALAVSGIGEKKKEKTAATPTDVDLATASAEIQINVDLYPAYIAWLEDHIPKKGQTGKLTIAEALYEAARFMQSKYGHGSHVTLRGYLNTLTVGKNAPYLKVDHCVVRRADYEQQGALA